MDLAFLPAVKAIFFTIVFLLLANSGHAMEKKNWLEGMMSRLFRQTTSCESILKLVSADHGLKIELNEDNRVAMILGSEPWHYPVSQVHLYAQVVRKTYVNDSVSVLPRALKNVTEFLKSDMGKKISPEMRAALEDVQDALSRSHYAHFQLITDEIKHFAENRPASLDFMNDDVAWHRHTRIFKITHVLPIFVALPEFTLAAAELYHWALSRQATPDIRSGFLEEFDSFEEALDRATAEAKKESKPDDEFQKAKFILTRISGQIIGLELDVIRDHIKSSLDEPKFAAVRSDAERILHLLESGQPSFSIEEARAFFQMQIQFPDIVFEVNGEQVPPQLSPRMKRFISLDKMPVDLERSFRLYAEVGYEERKVEEKLALQSNIKGRKSDQFLEGFDEWRKQLPKDLQLKSGLTPTDAVARIVNAIIEDDLPAARVILKEVEIQNISAMQIPKIQDRSPSEFASWLHRDEIAQFLKEKGL